MSVKVMSMVFDRYPTGGSEMLLALALADHAHDDGGSVRPGVAYLAVKTRQSERSVQYQLRRMEQTGWLLLVNSGNGGRNQRREYQISPAWVNGASLAQSSELLSDINQPDQADQAPETSVSHLNNTANGATTGLNGATTGLNGATTGRKRCNPTQERVQTVALAYNHHRTIIEPSIKHPMTYSEEFESAWLNYPNRPGRNKSDAYKAWSARLAAGDAPGDMIDGVVSYRAYCIATGAHPKFIKQPATFFGPGRHFASDWYVPVSSVNSDGSNRLDRRASFLAALTNPGDHHASNDHQIIDAATRLTN